MVVWAVSNIKMFWGKLVDAIKALISFSIVNTYEDSRGATGRDLTKSQTIFNDFVASSKVLWERTTNLDLQSHDHFGNASLPTELTQESKRSLSKVVSNTYGFSIRLMFGKLVACSRHIETAQKITITTTLRVFFASKKKFMAQVQNHIIEEIVKSNATFIKRDTIRVYNGDTACGEKAKRSMDSIFTNGNEHLALLDSINAFLNNKEKYRKLSYPYNYSALLYGEPGCGKTSTILAIASALNRNITYVNLSKLSVSRLLNKLNNADGDICVFEDIDALTTGVAESRGETGTAEPRGVPLNPSNGCDDSPDEVPAEIEIDAFGIPHPPDSPSQLPETQDFATSLSSLVGTSLSDILNITDGLLASEGSICLFTTNHIEKLDPAFLRSGRMNALIKFSKLNAETASRMIKANLDWEVEPALLKDSISPAELQEEILRITLGKSTREHLQERFFKDTSKLTGGEIDVV